MAQFNVSTLSPSSQAGPRMLTMLFAKITLKKDAPQEELEAAKKKVTDQGGKIVSEFSLIKGFTYVVLPCTKPP